MALDPVPWFIGGGAEHGPEVARMLAYAATSGAEGVISPTDLRVTALPTPGAAVRVYPGGAVMLNRYPGAPNQSYTVRSPSATDVSIPATTSSGGATRYVILRVDDPQYGGQTPTNVVSGPYVRYAVVNSITNLAYPFIPVARINQPASTATITQAMITDLRDVANPRTKREVFIGPGAVQNLTSTSFTQWPSVSAQVDIPTWATQVKILAHINGASQVGKTYGGARLEFGTIQSGATSYDINSPSTTTDGARLSTIGIVLGNAIPSNLRGTTQTLKTMAYRAASESGYLRADGATHVEYDVWFQEVAD